MKMKDRNLIQIILDQFAISISDDTGHNTTFQKAMLSKLEQTLLDNLTPTSISSFIDTFIDSGVRVSRTGPILNNGRQYTTNQVLDMYVEDFIVEHAEFEEVDKYFKGYFRKVSLQILEAYGWAHRIDTVPRGTVKVKEVIEFPTEEIGSIRRIGERSIRKVNNFMQKHYFLKIGRKIEGETDQYESKSGPNIDGQYMNSDELLTLTPQEFLNTHLNYFPEHLMVSEYLGGAIAYLIDNGIVTDKTVITMRQIIQVPPKFVDWPLKSGFDEHVDRGTPLALNLYLRKGYNLRLGMNLDNIMQ